MEDITKIIIKQFRCLGGSSERESKIYPCCPDNSYPYVAFNIKLKKLWCWLSENWKNLGQIRSLAVFVYIKELEILELIKI